MHRRSLWASAIGLLLGAIGVSQARAETPAGAKISLHVGSAAPAMMAVSLKNIAAAAGFYAERGQTVAIELVANGPGYAMLRDDVSPMKSAIAATKRASLRCVLRMSEQPQGRGHGGAQVTGAQVTAGYSRSAVSDVEQIANVAELGVVMLLFLIGLELRPQRLWVMRQAVTGFV